MLIIPIFSWSSYLILNKGPIFAVILIEEGYEKVYSMVFAVHVGRRSGWGAIDGREGSGCKGDKVRSEGSQYCIRQDNPGFGNLFGRRPDREMYVYVYQ